MTLPADEFMRRFLMHVLPSGFHRIRHYGLSANATRKTNLAKARLLLEMKPLDDDAICAETDQDVVTSTFTCRSCSAPMMIIAVIAPDHAPRAPP